MSLFICPNCDQHSQLEGENERTEIPHACPHCGREFKVDKELNVILEE